MVRGRNIPKFFSLSNRPTDRLSPPCFPPHQLRLLDSVDESLRHPVEEVQAKAVAACRAFTKAYFGQGASRTFFYFFPCFVAVRDTSSSHHMHPPTYTTTTTTAPSERLQARVVDKYLGAVLADDNVAVTRGFTLALGALPARLLRPSVDPILAALDEMARPDRCVGLGIFCGVLYMDGPTDARAHCLLTPTPQPTLHKTTTAAWATSPTPRRGATP